MGNVWQIKIEAIENAKTLNKICCGFDEDIDIISGRYVIDAKSLLGIFSIDLTMQVSIEIHSTDEVVLQRFANEIKDYVA